MFFFAIFQRGNTMFKVIFAALVNKVAVHSKAVAIRGNYSHGSQDRPGIWFQS
jgi:hypothetical protein